MYWEPIKVTMHECSNKLQRVDTLDKGIMRSVELEHV